MATTSPVFRFTESDHSYWLDDQRIPSITQLLEMGELVNGALYFTESSRDRGTSVHALCEVFDLGIVTPATCDSPHRGYLLAYAAAMRALKPEWEQIEIADAHPVLKFAGRPDRVGKVFRRMTIGEIKSGCKAKHHAVQTALQAVLKSGSSYPQIRERDWQRLTIYLKDSGRFSVDEHTDPRDFDVAHDLIRRFC